MEKLNYKNLFVRAVKEGAEEHKAGEKKPYDLIRKEIFDGKLNGKFRKVMAATQLLLEILPQIVSEKMKDAINDKDYNKLPFDFNRYELQEKIGRGAVSKVHLLQAKEASDPSYVLKICYTKDGTVEELQKIAQAEHKEYEKITAVYKDIENFTPAEQSIITTDKKSDKPVIATIQEYMGQNMRDFFTEIERGELEQMLEQDMDFREEFLKFADISARLFQEKGEIIDLMGNKNLSIVEINGKPHLRFIDPHNISSTTSDDEKRVKKLTECLDYIKEIRNNIKIN